MSRDNASSRMMSNNEVQVMLMPSSVSMHFVSIGLFFIQREDRERELRQQKENERLEKLKKQQEEELRRKEEEKKRKAEEKAAKSKALREAKGL